MLIDAIDRALIVELQHDGRAPLTLLGQKLGVSHVTIRNRLDRLIGDRVIKISAIVDPTKLGFPIQVFIGIHSDLKHVESLEEKLPRVKEVTFVSSLTGRFDLMIGAACTSREHLKELLTHKLSRLPGIRDTETFEILSSKRIATWEVPMRPPEDRAD